MRKPKRKLTGTSGVAGKTRPAALGLALIRQFATSLHVEKGLAIPDNIFFIN